MHIGDRGESQGGDRFVESNLRYYERRAMQEQAAARTALTTAARDRRLLLAAQFRAKIAELTAALSKTVAGLTGGYNAAA